MNKKLIVIVILLNIIALCNANKLVKIFKNENYATGIYLSFKNAKHKLNKKMFIQSKQKFHSKQYSKSKVHLSNEILLFDYSEKLINYRLAFEIQNFLHQSKITLQNVSNLNTSNILELNKIKKLKKNLEKYDFCFILQHPPCYTLGSSADSNDILLNKNDFYIEELGDLYNNFNSSHTIHFINKYENIKNEIDNCETYDEKKDYFDEFLQNINKKKKIPIYSINRGGKATYHGPGQLVFYFILNLKNYSSNYSEKTFSSNSNSSKIHCTTQKNDEYHLPNENCNKNTMNTEYIFDLHKTMNNFQKIGMETLNKFKIKAYTIEDKIGVFYNHKKIISIGLKIRKYISMHGMSLNFNINKNFLKFLFSCGMDHSYYTSLHELDEIKENNNINDNKINNGNNFLRILKVNFIESLKNILNVKVKIVDDISNIFF